MADHKLTISYDDATGKLTAAHRCAVDVAGVRSSHARDVDLSPDAVDALRAILDLNREQMEAEAAALGVAHAAAVLGKQKPGVKTLKAGGSLGGLGGADPKKA